MKPVKGGGEDKGGNKKEAPRRRGSVADAAGRLRGMSLSDAQKAASSTKDAVSSAASSTKDAVSSAARTFGAGATAAAKAAGAKTAQAAASAAEAARHAAEEYAKRKERKETKGSTTTAPAAIEDKPKRKLDMSHQEQRVLEEAAAAYELIAFNEAVTQIDYFLRNYNTSNKDVFAEVVDFIDQNHFKDRVPSEYARDLDANEKEILKTLIGRVDLSDEKTQKIIAVRFINERYFKDDPNERFVEEEYVPEPEVNPFAGAMSLGELQKQQDEENARERIKSQRISAEFELANRRSGRPLSATEFGNARSSKRTEAAWKKQLNADLVNWGVSGAGAENGSSRNSSRSPKNRDSSRSPKHRSGRPSSTGSKRT